MRMILGWLLLFTVLLVAPLDSDAQFRPLVFTHATVIDMTGAEPKPEMTVVVIGKRIAAIGETGKVRVPDNAQMVDATGRFLIPGLWDMHVHLFNNISGTGTNNKDRYFPLLIANGVTGVRDMFSDADDIKLAGQWQSEIDAGETIGPRIALGSRIVDGVPTFLPNLMGVKTAEEARNAVRTLKDAGAGFIKVYWNLSPEAFYAIADESKKLGIDFAGHVPFSMSAADVSDAGQKSIEHLTGLLETCSSKEDELRKKEWSPEVAAELRATYDEQKCLALFQRFAKNSTWHTPTAVLHRGMMLHDDEKFRGNINFKYVSAATLANWGDSPQVAREPELKIRKQFFQKLLETIGTMHGAGVPILAGTDVGNPFVIAGFDLHDELELFVLAGMTPIQALQTATVNPAKYLGMIDSMGTIEVGKFADLVLLDANPIDNISNTKRIEAVVFNGSYVSKEAREKMLADVEADVKNN